MRESETVKAADSILLPSSGQAWCPRIRTWREQLIEIVGKKKNGTYATVSGWLKAKNPNYTQSEQRHELFDSFKAKQKTLPPIPKKPPVRSRPLASRAKKASSQ
jgi:hypothetical protein